MADSQHDTWWQHPSLLFVTIVLIPAAGLIAVGLLARVMVLAVGGVL